MSPLCCIPSTLAATQAELISRADSIHIKSCAKETEYIIWKKNVLFVHWGTEYRVILHLCHADQIMVPLLQLIRQI
jgi:hypothetical protein